MGLSGREVTSLQYRVLDIVNRIRRSRGLGELRLSGTLSRCAASHTRDQIENIGSISHSGSDNSTLKDRLRRYNYDSKRASENVASGQDNAEHVMRSLMNSPGHRENIVDPDVVEMGLDVEEDKNGLKYWTQLFGQRLGRSKRGCICKHRRY